MKAWLIAPVLALAAIAATPSSAPAFENGAFSCRGPFCCAMNCFPHMHQHGPLYNYGPYYGYYPFEPYGPWTSDLRYNPQPTGHSHSGIFSKSSCGSSWGSYSLATLKNVFHRTHPCGNKVGCCSGCQ